MTETPEVALLLGAALLAGAAAWCWHPGVLRRGALHDRRRQPAFPAWPLTCWTRRKSKESQASAVAALTAALASELRSGRTPDQAMSAVLGGWFGPLPGRFVPGSDVATFLSRWSLVPGWSGLAAVVICWRVADSTGAGLADALDRIGDAMRHEHEVATEVSGQLASVRATAMVLATLPLVAVAMGHLLGARPVQVLVGTVSGLVCLVVGGSLALAGWWWLTRQVESVRKTLRW